MRKYMTIEEYYKRQSKDKKVKRNKILRSSFTILCLIIIIFSLTTILKWIHDNSKIRQINEEINKDIKIEKNSNQGVLVNPPTKKDDSYYYYAKMPFYEVNFSILKEKNSDTVGFIHIRNTNINYPIVQSLDNSYYLNHSFDKTENKAGWIFMDFRNDIDNLTDNTIIYGHSRLDGSMFGSLKETLLYKWQNNRDNYAIFISTPKENMIFQIFSIYTIRSEGYYIITSFSSTTKKEKWLSTMKSRNTSSINAKVNAKDKILTLSTCQNNQGGRIVIHAKLIKKQSKT